MALIFRDWHKRSPKGDGCTASPDRMVWPWNKEWRTCCQAHDDVYKFLREQGGHYSREQFLRTRKLADRSLRLCMAKKRLYVLPWVFWVAVRLFGGRAADQDIRKID